MTHYHSKWERAEDYLKRLHLAGFNRDTKLMAPLGIRDICEDFLDVSTVFDVPYPNDKPLRSTSWSDASKINKKAGQLHKACVQAGFTPLFILVHHNDGFLPSRIACESEAEGVIISGLWTAIEIAD